MSTRTSGIPRVALGLLLAAFAAGCGGSSTGEATTEQASTTPAGGAAQTGAPTVEQAREAGAIARAIEAEPGRTSQILGEHHTTQEAFERLIVEIAKDPTLSEAYEQARAGS